MRTLEAGNNLTPTLGTAVSSLPHTLRMGGFTLLELLVVITIMAIATAGVGLAMRDSSQTQLEREGQRLAALLEAARSQSRMSANPVRWRATANGFAFDGVPAAMFPSTWLGTDVRCEATAIVVLGPEPIIGPQQIRLVSVSQADNNLTIATDGVRPFAVLTPTDKP